jgi:hypothetical protein
LQLSRRVKNDRGCTVEDNVGTARQKAASTALFFFAFIGFIASIVVIASYFQPTNSGVLRVEITPNDFQVPLEFAQPFTDGAPARKMAADVKSAFCAPSSGASAVPKNPGATKSSNADIEQCDQASELESVARWASAFADSPGTLYRYDIENRGSGIAQKIRIAGTGVASLQVQREAKFVDIQPDKNDDFYVLPDLNPHEKVTVLIWMTSANSELTDYSDAPAVTFSGASVKKEILRRVPENWWSIYDAYGDMPTILLILFGVAISFAVTLGVVFVISILAALATGKPLRTVFETRQKTPSTDKDPG